MLSEPRTVSRTARAPRESIQLMAGPMACPAPSTGTVPDHCAVHPTPTTRSGATPLSASARRAAATMASHHPPGACSAPPSPVRVIPPAERVGAIRPVADSTATFGPPVPRSTARTYVAVGVLRFDRPRLGGRHGGEPDLTGPATDRPLPRRTAGQVLTAPGWSVGRAASTSTSITTLLPDHDAAVEQRVVEADAEVAPVDLRRGGEGDDRLALLHGLPSPRNSRSKSTGRVMPRTVRSVLRIQRFSSDPLQAGALQLQGRVVGHIQEVVRAQVVVPLDWLVWMLAACTVASTLDSSGFSATVNVPRPR